MCDTFRPLRLTTLCRDLDDGRYAACRGRRRRTARAIRALERDRRCADAVSRATACLRRLSCTRRSRPPPTARSPSTSTMTTRASATREYRARRNHIASAGAGLARRGSRSRTSTTPSEEQEVWRTVCRELAAKHERLACADYRDGDGAPGPAGRSHPRSSTRSGAGCARSPASSYHPAAGLVPLRGVLRLAGRRRSSIRPSTSATTPARCTRPSRT